VVIACASRTVAPGFESRQDEGFKACVHCRDAIKNLYALLMCVFEKQSMLPKKIN
jgi:hypothetical protein